jgi:class 3 adenylate cyclase
MTPQFLECTCVGEPARALYNTGRLLLRLSRIESVAEWATSSPIGCQAIVVMQSTMAAFTEDDRQVTAESREYLIAESYAATREAVAAAGGTIHVVSELEPSKQD